MLQRQTFFIAVVSLISLCQGAAAAAAGLDTDTIARWIEAAGELQVWSEAADEDLFDDNELVNLDGDRMPSLDEMRTGYIEALRRNADAGRIIGRYGFSGIEQWADVSARITMGMIAITLEDARPEIDAGMAELMRELENNPDIPAAQREMFMQQMQQAMGMTQQMSDNARPEDLPAIRAMSEQLQAVLGFDDD